MQEEWWGLANCRGTDPEAWYPENVNPTALGYLHRVCQPCEVQAECLAYAVNNHERGYWGDHYFPERGGA